MNKLTNAFSPAVFLVALLFAAGIPAHAQGPTAAAPYTLSVFATAPSGLSAPDSIAVQGNRVFVGYGDGHAPDGSDGLSSQIVEYRMDGSVAHTYTVLGHNDGLKIDPVTHRLWAIQNEDANARLVIFNTDTHERKLYLFGPAAHGGGYDDVVFRGCKTYISASNPASNPNNEPAILSARLLNGTVAVEPVLEGNANAIDVTTDSTVQLNLQDPDSMTLDPLGNIVLDSQADQELIIVSNPGGAHQRVLRLPLSFINSSGAATPVEVDDTNFATSTQGFILFADKGLNTVYKLTRNAFVPGTAYTAADGGPFVGTIEMTTGVITPIVTGLKNPGGLVFVNTSPSAGSRDRDDAESCRDHEDDSR